MTQRSLSNEPGSGVSRDCYCGLWQTNPSALTEQGVPKGYCGICERCGAPGHTRHYPGPKPLTGAWCGRCYKLIGSTWLLRMPGLWVLVIVLSAAGLYLIVG
jgi:hypothetical protein